MSAAILENVNVRLSVPTAEVFLNDWAVYRPFVELACTRTMGRMNADYVRDEIESESLYPFVVWEMDTGRILAVLVGEGSEYPGQGDGPVRVFSIILCGGVELERWRHLDATFADIAKNLGCQQYEITGRKGWERALGRKPALSTFVLDLTEEE